MKKPHKLFIVALLIWVANSIYSIKLGSFRPYAWAMIAFSLWLSYELIFNY